MLWNKNGSSLEIRTQGEAADGRPAPDEIVAHGASAHLEQMSHDQWFMGIEAGGKYFHLNFAMIAVNCTSTCPIRATSTPNGEAITGSTHFRPRGFESRRCRYSPLWCRGLAAYAAG